MNNIFLAFVRNDGSPRLAMAAMVTGSLSNIALDYLFIFPFGWGLFGAALATAIAPMISLALLSLHFVLIAVCSSFLSSYSNVKVQKLSHV